MTHLLPQHLCISCCPLSTQPSAKLGTQGNGVLPVAWLELEDLGEAAVVEAHFPLGGSCLLLLLDQQLVPFSSFSPFAHQIQIQILFLAARAERRCLLVGIFPITHAVMMILLGLRGIRLHPSSARRKSQPPTNKKKKDSGLEEVVVPCCGRAMKINQSRLTDWL